MYNYRTQIEVVINSKIEKGISNILTDKDNLSVEEISVIYKNRFADFDLKTLEILEITETN